MTQQEAQQQFQKELFEFQRKTMFPETSMPEHFNEWVKQAMPLFSPQKLKFNVPDYEECYLKVGNSYNLFHLANILWMLAQLSPKEMNMEILDYIPFINKVLDLSTELSKIVEPEAKRIERKMETMMRIEHKTPSKKAIALGKA